MGLVNPDSSDIAGRAQRRIVGDGTTDAAWRSWPGLETLPAVTAPELVPKGARAVIVAPHPDDELLGCGGLLQLLASTRRQTLLIAVTDGGASHPGSPQWPSERLLLERPLETARAFAMLGLSGPVLRARLPDGGVTRHAAQLRTLLETTLRPDDVVIATWRLDGHPDHEATGHAAAHAAASCGATLLEMPIWAWHWASPGDPRLPWQRARRLVLSAAVLQRKREALACYASQMQADASTGRPPIVPPSALERLLRPFEVYFS
jgi:LmbE family N-acetylglucosaminyl deacetylase